MKPNHDFSLRPLSRQADLGLTLVEIMMSVGIFAVGVSTVLGYLGTLNSVTSNTLARETRAIMVSNLANLIEGTEYDELATSNSNRTWALNRDSAGNQPMTINDLVSMHIVHYETGNLQGDMAATAKSELTKLRIYLEYYRVIDDASNPSSRPGLWGAQSTTQNYTQVTTPVSTGPSRLRNINTVVGLKDSSLVDVGNPIAARLIIKDTTVNPQTTVYDGLTLISTQ
jgi:Tfp pilus assembly protein PilV